MLWGIVLSSYKHFLGWKTRFLAERGLADADSRSLYAYRVDDEEFLDLENLLATWIGKFQVLASLGDFVNKVPGLPALFALYASEWWRRKYDGSGWAWDPIVRSIAGNPSEWTPTQRSTCVRLGLQQWRLKVRSTGGLRYLGAIALQGGLPMRLLAEAKGGLGRLLRTVLRETAKSSATSTDIEGWIRSLDHHLPRTYRQTEIYLLLAQVIEVVLQLKREAQLTESAGAVQRLDKCVPSWRTRFPLPVGDADAQGLIEQLIADVAVARVDCSTRYFTVERTLEMQVGRGWALHTHVDVPDKIPVLRLARLLDCSEADLPRFLELTLHPSANSRSITMRRMAGHAIYKVDRRPSSTSGSLASTEHTAHFSAADGRSWKLALSRGEALDDEIPWAFEGDGDVRRFLRQGSGSVASSSVLIALPSGWHEVDASHGCEVSEKLIEPSRSLNRFSGDLQLIGPEGMICRIKTGSEAGADESYTWQGRRLWDIFTRPTMGFLGAPKLLVTEGEQMPRPVDGGIDWRQVGGKSFVNETPVGLVEHRYPATGNIRQRCRMVVLPQHASLVVESSDASCGSICFRDWRLTKVVSLTQGVDVDIERSGSSLTAKMSVSSGLPPAYIDLDVYWGTTPSAARVRLPFPARGVVILDHADHLLPDKPMLAVHSLAGVRMRVVGSDTTSMPQMALELLLLGTRLQFVFPIRHLIGSIRTEVRLQDYASDISCLLASTDTLDARVCVQIRIAGKVEASVTVARFTATLTRLDDAVELDAGAIARLTPDELVDLPVMAMRLDAPDQEAIRLPARMSEGIGVGIWDVLPIIRGVGVWLIYPLPTAIVTFRPLLWTVEGNETEDPGSLAAAIRMTDISDRNEAIDAVIGQLAQNFLADEWESIEKLAAQIGHLPLQAVDLWRRFARSSAAMAAIALRLGALSPEFIERFAVELPFAWETVSFESWRSATEQLDRQCRMWYDVEAAAAMLNTHLSSRLDKLGTWSPAIRNMLFCARALALNEHPPEFTLFRRLGSEGIEKMLFSGDESVLQRLLRGHADVGQDKSHAWPTQFSELQERAKGDSVISAFLCPTPFNRRGTVVNTPLILAAQAAHGLTKGWFEDPNLIQDLRRYIAFDSDWFDEAYDWTVARCFAANRLVREF